MAMAINYERIPKLELHVHLDGALDAATLFEEAKQSTECAPELQACATVEEFIALISHPPGNTTLEAFLGCFSRFMPLLKGNMTLLETLTKKFCENQKRHNVLYTEVRYSPHLFGDDPMEVVSRITAVLASAGAELDIRVNQILCCLNMMPDASMEVVDLAHQFRENERSCVVGLDLAAGEAHFTDRHSGPMFQAAFDRARELNIPVTIHAGEEGAGTNVLLAINKYHAQRIGHGYHFVTDEDLKDAPLPAVHFEACLTSSWGTGAVPAATEPHPSLLILRKGGSIGLNSDDPSIFGSSISNEYKVAASIGFTMQDFYHMAQCQVHAAFDKSAANDVLPALDNFYLPLMK